MVEPERESDATIAWQRGDITTGCIRGIQGAARPPSKELVDRKADLAYDWPAAWDLSGSCQKGGGGENADGLRELPLGTRGREDVPAASGFRSGWAGPGPREFRYLSRAGC